MGRYLWAIALFFTMGANAQVYTAAIDDCVLNFSKRGKVEASLNIADTRWIDISGGDYVQFFDGEQSIYLRANQIGNYAGDQIDSLKAQVKEWRRWCADIKTSFPLSAFGDLRTTELTPQFQGAFEYTIYNTDLTLLDTAGSGKVHIDRAMAVVQTFDTVNSVAALRSTNAARYRAGFGGIMRFTALFSPGATGAAQLVGLADRRGNTAYFSNGYVIGIIDSVFGVARFSADSLEEFIPLANCDDPLDGSGFSGMTIDLSKLNVFQIQYGYLGAHAIRFFVEDIETGTFTEFHKMHYAGEREKPSVQNPNFHFYMLAENGQSGADVYLKTASYAYLIEGTTGVREVQQQTYGSGERSKTTVTSEVAILTIRNDTTYASKPNYIDLLLLLSSASSESAATNNLANARIVKNATLGGSPSWTKINQTNSVVSIDVAGTTVTGGVTIATIPLAGKNASEQIALSPFVIILHPGESITIAGSSDNSSTIKASIVWKELF